MFRPADHLYAFDSFVVDPLKRTVLRDEKPVHLTPKAFEILVTLLENQGKPIDKKALMNSVWPDTIVEENNLTRNISSLRKALGEKPDEHRYVVTIPGYGYSFVANVQLLPFESSEVVRQTHLKPRFVIQDNSAPNIERAAVIAPSNPWTIFRKNRAITLLAAFLAIGSVLVVGLWLAGFFGGESRNSEAREPFQTMKPSKLTNIGNVVAAAISPDGEYVAYAVDEGGSQSVYLRRASSEGNTRIVAPADIDYWGLTFTPRTDHLYYVAWERNKTDAVLYRVPFLGGVSPQRLLNNVGTRVTFSPDGKMLAFANDTSTKGESSLVIAASDGSQERELVAVANPAFFSSHPHSGPAWSPDGQTIASAYGAVGQRTLVQVRITDGTIEPITSYVWHDVGQVDWLSDGKGLVVVAKDGASAANQLWHVSYPAGVVRRITNDLLGYSGVSVAANSDTLVTVQHNRIANLWMAPGGERGVAKQISDDKVGEFFSWTADNKIVFISNISGKSELWIMDHDGTGAKQLTIDGKVRGNISVSRDGRYVIFASNRSGTYHIWRMNSDGSSPIQLTNGDGELYSHLSPDGKWVVYRQGYDWGVRSTIWKVSIDGGEPVQITREMSLQPNVSPDGRTIAYFYMDANVWGLATVPLEGGEPLKRFRIPPSVGSRVVRWMPDGTALAYIANVEDVSNIWLQPINGSSPKKLTNFDFGQISYFDWSFDGKQIAFSRERTSNDVVLINDFR